MSNDLLNQSRARVASAQAELDQALLAGTDTGPARQFLATAEAEVQRIEATLEAETARIEAETSQTLNGRAQELVAKDKAELLAEFESAGITDVPAFDLPLGVAISYLKASDQADDELMVEQKYREESYALQTRINERGAKMAAITERRLGGDTRPSDANEFVLLQADRDSLKSLLSRLVRPQVGRAVEWVEDARKQWHGEIGRVRAHLLKELAAEADERVLRLARLMSTTRYGISPTRYFPSLAMQKALSGRVF